MSQRILHSLLFYPRGGSAQVGRSLAARSRELGHEAVIVSGSIGQSGDYSHAPTFYEGLPLAYVDYNGAQRAFDEGRDPMTHRWPFHPSYEDRGAVPDRLFSAVSPMLYEWSARRWAEHLLNLAERFIPTILHLHHLTPQHVAARRVFRSVRSVVHLHGTELKMLEMLNERTLAGASVQEDPLVRHGAFWSTRMGELARAGDAVITTSPADSVKAVDLLGIDTDVVASIPNGVDHTLFRPKQRTPAQRAAALGNAIIDNGRGWDRSGVMGSIRYSAADLGFLNRDGDVETPVIAYVGRFTAVKRVNLLLEAFHRYLANGGDAALVILGGFPGEWEGEHPYDFAQRHRLRHVYFAGWRTHAELAQVMPFVDLLALPSIDESFGQVLLESMSCGVPVIAVNRGGPPSFVVSDGISANGWLVEPDDVLALVRSLQQALGNADELRARGRAGRKMVVKHFSWEKVTERFVEVYEALQVGGPDGTLTRRHRT